MGVITEFRIRSSGLVLWETQQACPELELEVIQEVGTDPERPFVFLWASGVDPDRFEEAMAGDPTVSVVDQYSRTGDGALYRVRISASTETVLYPHWVELGVEHLESRWADGWWKVRMRFPDRETVATYRERCESLGVEFELQRVYADESGTIAHHGPLTDDQREALVRAYEAGYFAVPRQASMADVADELGVSSQAVSERLRRAHQRLVEHHLP